MVYVNMLRYNLPLHPLGNGDINVMVLYSLYGIISLR